ncbi:MAG: TlpA family protein disulfide reductase [Deltaproteobacteria bacterium]|nr:MAG: TlpA family protein disulfide reductase [Deltaproteobacteria bacterium]
MKIRWRALASTILLCVFAFGTAGAAESPAPAVGAGGEAPPIELHQPDGKLFRLSECLSSSKAVVVSMWGIRCGACLDEMKHLNVLHGRYREKGVTFVGVNVDGIDAATLAQFLGSMPVRPEYPVVADPAMSVVDSYRMTAVPLTFLIDPKGAILSRHEGFQEGDEKILESEIRKMVGP